MGMMVEESAARVVVWEIKKKMMDNDAGIAEENERRWNYTGEGETPEIVLVAMFMQIVMEIQAMMSL